MHYQRIVPVVLLKEGLLVRSQLFKFHQAIGDPIPTIKRLSDWSVDEIVFLNISKSSILDSRRDDKWHNIGKTHFSQLIQEVSKYCFCPLSVGGGIRSLKDFEVLFASGADKCIVNTLIHSDPDLVREASRIFGNQAIVASIDVKRDRNRLSTYIERGTVRTGFSLSESVVLAAACNVGELLISSIDSDGSNNGYDSKILSEIQKIRYNCTLPIVINSGATLVEHFSHALQNYSIQAVAASNIFYFTELSYPRLKDNLLKDSCNLRPNFIHNTLIARDYSYPDSVKNKLLEKRDPTVYFDRAKYDGSSQVDVKFCTKCLYPSLSATPMEFNDQGVCMGCVVSAVKLSQTSSRYDDLKLTLNDICTKVKSVDGYDCIVSVSGGKDSYYQTHYVIHELGLKPLLVTYNGNNYSEVGWRNLMNMRKSFDCDHIIVSPSISTLKKLNKLAFYVMGDMNWHAHVGIFTTAPRIAIQQNIPLIFWGEHGYADLCGQFSMHDFPEMNYRERTEHSARGFDWQFFVGIDDISSQDMELWKYPTDAQLFDSGLRQIYLGHYIPWEANYHLQLMVDRYGFEISDDPFDRTYRRGSNLDDIHENGIHDYLKYIKFGYGRCTDHASKDIRAAKIDRQEAIRLVNHYDPIKPRDLYRWLDYVDMTESEFDRVCDLFRDPRVWKFDDTWWSRKKVTLL